MKHSDFDLVKVIGRGAFGEVQLVMFLKIYLIYNLCCKWHLHGQPRQLDILLL